MDPAVRGFPALSRDIDVDIAIVGGGLSGMGAAHALRHSGRSVALLEERAIGAGASGRNAGFLLHGPAMEFASAVQQLGVDQALGIWRFTEENNLLIAGIAGRGAETCGYLRRGSMSLASSAEEARDLSESNACLAEVGIASCLVRRDQLPVPFDEMYEGGLYYPGNGEIDPGRFLALVADGLPSGVSIFEHSAVRSVEFTGCWELVCGSARVRADQVILATNAYTKRLLPGIQIEPRRGQVLSTPPLDRVVVPFPMYADRGFQYWRQTPEGGLVAGGWRNRDLDGEVGIEDCLHAGIQDALDEFCLRVLGVAPAVEHRWAGIMGFTPDHLPLVGPVPGQAGLWIAAGYSGHGVCMAFLCGARVAQASNGSVLDLPESFSPERFPVSSFNQEASSAAFAG
jgi:gamma-glutamylputrescine oxidase